MKHWILILLIVIFGSAAGALWYLNSQATPSEDSTLNLSKTKTATTATTSLSAGFHAGIVIRPYGLKGPGVAYAKSQLETQFSLAKELGVTDVRANVEGEMTTNDDFVNLAIENKMIPTLILEPINPNYLDTDAYTKAYDYAKLIASRYVGKVPYYQLGNEASGVAIKEGAPGNKLTDYDPTKYTKLKDMLRGLGDGVRAADERAKRIVSANWIGVAIIDKLIADKISFEIIGWNWYSEMGADLSKKLDDGTTLTIPDYLAKYHKDFWVVELNRSDGTFDGNEKAQADFLTTFVANMAKRPLVTGLFVFTLTDECGALDKGYGHLGLVSLTKNADNVCTVKAKKSGFAALTSAFAARATQ